MGDVLTGVKREQGAAAVAAPPAPVQAREDTLVDPLQLDGQKDAGGKARYDDVDRAMAASGVGLKRVTPNRSGVSGDAFLFYNFPIGKADANVRDNKSTRVILEALNKAIYKKRKLTTEDPNSKNKWSHGRENPDEAAAVGQIKVAGYSDKVDFSEGAKEDGKSNHRLRTKRAYNIKKYLEKGLKNDKQKMGKVSVIQETPDGNFLFGGGDDATTRSMNRSVLVWILPEAKAQKPVDCAESNDIAQEIQKRALKDSDKTGVFTANIMKMFCQRSGIDGGFLHAVSVQNYVASQADKAKPADVTTYRDAFQEIEAIVLANRADKETAYKQIRTVTEHIMSGYQEAGRYVNIYTGHDYRGGWLDKIITGKRTHALPPHIEKLVMWFDAKIKGASVYQAFSKDK